MSIAHVLVRPLVTEKTTSQLNGASTYAFEVALASGKAQIKDAIESFYGVQVDSVRTLIVRGKIKRSGRFAGKRSNWKKAYVSLSSGQSINLFET